MSKILTLQPFNDLFYKSCFYSSLFPVLKYYGRPIDSFLSNDIAVWGRTDSMIPYDLELRSIKREEEIMDELQITHQTKDVSDRIVEDLIKSIDEGKIPLMRIDCFYSSIRSDLYQKEHWPHVITVFGYHIESKVFFVLEHKMRENMSYERRTMSFNDIVASYEGYLSHFKETYQYPTFYQYSAVSVEALSDMQHEYAEVYLSHLRDHYDLIQSGIYELGNMIEFIIETCSNLKFLDLHLNGIIELLNRIVNVKTVDQYRLMNWFPDEPALTALESSIRLWKKVRGPIVKYQYTNLYSQESILISEIRTLLEAERMYLASVEKLSRIKGA